MIEFKEFVEQIRNNFKISDEHYYKKITQLLADNDWFGITPIFKDNLMYVNENDFFPYMDQLYMYLSPDSEERKIETINETFEGKYKNTYNKLIAFQKESHITNDELNNLIQFFLKFLTTDLYLYNDGGISNLIELAVCEMPKYMGDILTLFLAWCIDSSKGLKKSERPLFHNYYRMHTRSVKTNEAYELEEYLEMIYYLFNEDYISRNNMLLKAAEDKNYVDTWLFLALHFVCALRNTDLLRIYHPKLPYTPEEILEQVKEETFKDETAVYVLNTVIWRLNVMPLRPNKTMKSNGISDIKLHIPESLQVLFGTLFAVAEAHFQLSKSDSEEPLIRVINTYEKITKYMGDEIGSLFLLSDFHTRSATKSYLQSIFKMADEILDEEDEFHVKGYMLAALARSHKGSYGQFAQTTATYIKDAKLSGLSAEYVAKELFERGVLSCIPSMALKMVTNGEYNKLSVSNQTKLIKELNMTPGEIERSVAISEESMKRSENIVYQLVNNNSNEEVLKILHRIGNGTAVSKQNECLCLVTAMKKECPYHDRSNCIGCQYEISTKSTIFLLMSELNRLQALRLQTNNNRLKDKYLTIIKESIIPAIDEVISCAFEEGGQEAVTSLEYIIKENKNG